LRKRNTQLEAIVLLSTKRSDIHALLRSFTTPQSRSTLSLEELELQNCMLRALVHSLRQDDINGLGTLISFFIFARQLVGPAHADDAKRDNYRVAVDFHLANRLLQMRNDLKGMREPYSDETLLQLTRLLHRQLDRNLNHEPALLQRLHEYANLVGQESVSASQQFEACQSILPILLFTFIPPLGVLKQIRCGLDEALRNNVIERRDAPAFVQAILDASKVKFPLISHFVRAWLT
jgi:hypothetical protein